MIASGSILSTWAILDTIRSSMLSGKLGAVQSASSVLAAMMAAASLLDIAADYIDGRGVGIWQLAKPLVLLALVCQFNTLVLSPLHSVTNAFTRSLAESSSISTKQYTEQWAHNASMVTAITMEENKEGFASEMDAIAESDSSAFGKIFAKIWTALKKVIKDMFSSATLTVAGIVGAILFILVKILLFAQQVLCAVYLTISGLIGPIVFALGIIPGFSSGIRSWIARYIQIAMWVPLGYFLLGMNMDISNAFCNKAAADGADLSLEWFMIALQVVALVSVAAVPKFAAYVVESTGANDAHGALSQPFRNLARTIIKF